MSVADLTLRGYLGFTFISWGEYPTSEASSEYCHPRGCKDCAYNGGDPEAATKWTLVLSSTHNSLASLP
jgi:hypothetical protein